MNPFDSANSIESHQYHHVPFFLLYIFSYFHILTRSVKLGPSSHCVGLLPDVPISWNASEDELWLEKPLTRSGTVFGSHFIFEAASIFQLQRNTPSSCEIRAHVNCFTHRLLCVTINVCSHCVPGLEYQCMGHIYIMCDRKRSLWYQLFPNQS